MSNLKKPYEISVWQDIWQGDKFCEQRLGIIGTNEMSYQGRAIEPNLVRNVNGTKKFSFKMYKHFIDTTTGEKVDNPFIEWLISERKVKLKYEKDEDGNDIWYDFIIKDVVENSSNYLYTYQLEDALVQELSKNGFGVTLDEQLRNNMGNVEHLAIEALKETDWTVESEVFVERVDEALVYVQLPESLSNGSKVYKLLDDGDDFLERGLETEEDDSVLGKMVLAFYSSCRNKPHRFQFIFLPNYEKASVSIDRNRQILNKNCQYYIEFEPNKYTIANADYGFILPEGFSVVPKTYIDGSDIVNASDSTISTWYRGGRYGFAQRAEYIPLLDRYCQVYSGPTYSDYTSETGNSNTYYGYVDNKYEDLIFSTNLVENTEFSNTSGWTGTYKSDDASADKAVVESVYGKFVGNSFVSTTDVLAGTVDIDKTFEEFLDDSDNKCAPYLKVELKSGDSLVINSGPYHNRTLIGNMPVGSKWALRAECYSNNGSNASLTFDIDEYTYNTTYGHYSAPEDKKIEFVVTNQDDYTIYTVETNNFEDEKDFTKTCKLKIAISGNEGTYYIKNLEFFRARFDKDNEVIPLESQGTDIENLITTQYRYFKPSELDTATEAKGIHYDYETDTLSYETYKPVYNTNGEKIRAVSAKESNYFNILQSIAETFECWLDLQIIRNDPTQPGAITQKIAKFKNYAGGDNYACFRYGVNLKDIQRTYSSKNIVTKLMVKQNSNEHGENGICTIARAGANPTGDTSIYDFSYFQNMGLMNAHDYIDTMYKIDGAEGPDVNDATSYNIQGYFPRIRAINDQLLDKVDEEIVLKQQLLKLNSDLEVQKAKQSAAASGMEEASESYFQITGVRPTELVDGKVTIANIALDTENKYNASNEEKKGHLSYYDSDSNSDYILSISKNDNEIVINAEPSSDAFEKTKTLSITAYPILTTQNKSEFVQTLYFTLEIKKDETSATSQKQMPVINTEASQVKKYFNEYAEYAAQKHEADIKVPELESSINSLQSTYNGLVNTIQILKNHKIALNNLFFARYSRFVQEGSWIDEKYYDNEKYYNDALSVMYNSCYPQVAYTINTFEVSQLPGYEMFNFNVGEKTWAEDGDFFGFNEDGSPKREEVVITEKSENLDDPSKNTNKVQNFKNQFQDLFQRITATVQQAQYSTGAYEKGVAEANAIAEDSVGFLREAMSAMTVNLDNPQVMSESTDKSSQLRIVDGKVLIGKRNQNTEEISWTTGLSSDGIAADLINTGRLNTSEIQIYGGDNPTFRWDAKGISAYDYTNFNNVISGVNTNKFVRFDKHGIYGIDGGVDADWVPGQVNSQTALEEIDDKATFALTWEGLKVKNSNGVTLRLGDGAKGAGNDTDLLVVNDNSGGKVFAITENGSFLWSSSSAPAKTLYARTLLNQPDKSYDSYDDDSDTDWHKVQTSEDWYASYSYDGGETWSLPSQIQSAGTERVKEWYYATSDSTKTPTIDETKEENGETKSIWSESPAAAGHDAVNKYLWNYEETVLTNGTSVYSSPALTTTQPKNISKIYEFYRVTNSNSTPTKPTGFSWNGSTLGYTNTNPAWTMVDTSSGSASGLSTEQSEYLWNFEVICYDDNTCTVGSIANIGTGGKGISDVQNWYKRTSTEASKPNKPTSLEDADEKWSKSVPDYSSEEGNCYLWTCESTIYSDSKTPVFTDVTLLSREPRNIKTITEYYYKGTGTPEEIALDSDANSYTVGADWSTTMYPPDHGESLWNCELIEYSTKDEQGKNLYKVVPAARIGYIGVETYTLALDNDADMVVKSSDGTWISTGNIVVTPTRYEGHNISDDGVLEITAPNDGKWSSSGDNANYSTVNNKLTITINKITSETGGEFTFKWKSSDAENASIYAEKKFRLGITTTLADYDLIIPRTVYNTSQGAFNNIHTEFTVQKKSQDGTKKLTSVGSEPICMYVNSIANDNKIVNWGGEKTIDISQNSTTPIKIILASTDSNPIIWDEETIEMTKDGSSLICVTPDSVQSKSTSEWKNYSGSNETLTLKDISNLRVGNSVYFVGEVSDKWWDQAGTIHTSVTVYATITDIANDTSTITVTIDSVIFGAEAGANGSDATVNFANIWGAFNNATDDQKAKGIYVVNADGQEHWVVDASAISAGALRVGDSTNIDKDNPQVGAAFYADMTFKKVYIAGWEVTENSIITTDRELGNESSIILSTAGIKSTDKKFGNDDVNAEWMLGIGSNFGVTSNGELYATAGKIGDLTIGDIAGKQDINNIEIGGRNLIADTDNTTIYSGKNENNDYKDVWTGKTIVAPTDTEYIISFDAKADVKQSIKCFFYSPDTTLTSESSTGQLRDNVVDGSAEVEITTEWKRYWVKWTQTSTDTIKNIVVGRNETTNNIYIRAVKLEKGNKATAWTPAPEDQMNSNVNTNDFSWKFSPTEGMFMWNGQQQTSSTDKTRGAVLAIYNNGTADRPEYKLSMKGHVEAKSGQFGKLLIDNTQATINSNQTTFNLKIQSESPNSNTHTCFLNSEYLLLSTTTQVSSDNRMILSTDGIDVVKSGSFSGQSLLYYNRLAIAPTGSNAIGIGINSNTVQFDCQYGDIPELNSTGTGIYYSGDKLRFRQGDNTITLEQIIGYDERLKAMGFKGPYFLYLSEGTQTQLLGSIWQQGSAIGGQINSVYFDSRFFKENKKIQYEGNISAPKNAIQLVVHMKYDNIYYLPVTINIEEVNGTLALTITKVGSLTVGKPEHTKVYFAYQI